MAWAPDYCTSAELKAYINVSDSIDDTQVALVVTAASRAVDSFCGRQFGVVASAEERVYLAYPDYQRRRYAVDFDDLMTMTNLAVVIDDVTTTDYTLEPRNSDKTGVPWTRIVFADGTTVDEAAITAIWGWTAVPSPIKQATLLQAARLLKRRDAPFGIAGSPDQGSELRLLARLDPDVQVMLANYRRAVAF